MVYTRMANPNPNHDPYPNPNPNPDPSPSPSPSPTDNQVDIGMAEQERAEVQQAIAAILALGDLDFGDAPDEQAKRAHPNTW